MCILYRLLPAVLSTHADLRLHSIVETGSRSPPTRSLRSDGYNRMSTTDNPFQGLSNRVATAHPVVSVRVVVNSVPSVRILRVLSRYKLCYRNESVESVESVSGRWVDWIRIRALGSGFVQSNMHKFGESGSRADGFVQSNMPLVRVCWECPNKNIKNNSKNVSVLLFQFCAILSHLLTV